MPGNLPALFTASLTALFLELLLIRWESSEIPILAYFKNFPLLSVFLGLGLGCLLARSPVSRWRSGLWALTGIVLVTACAHRLGLDGIIFPEANMDVWGRVFDPAGQAAVLESCAYLLGILGILAANAWAFIGLGQAIGGWLAGGGTLRAYTTDILGSLAGVAAFAGLSALQTPPAVWLVVGAAGLAAVAWRLDRLRESTAPLAVLVGIALVSAPLGNALGGIVRWSPYYRVEVTPAAVSPPPESAVLVYALGVNRDYHQIMADIADGREPLYRTSPQMMQFWNLWRMQYTIAYKFRKAPHAVLIGGAGSGNNAAGALRNGAGRVTAVEIDPAIFALGRALHPLKPYLSPRVTGVITDVRSFVRRSHESFDLIEYGILDSHTALSALSSLRLENYVYTVEGIRDAVARLAPGGVMVLSFHDLGRPWLGRRLFRNITAATGTSPVCTHMAEMAFFIFGPGANPDEARDILRRLGLPDSGAFYAAGEVLPSTDDWPFLYANPAGQPVVYFLALALVVGLGSLAILAVLHGPGVRPPADWPMFFLGAGFLLIETKALAEVSLLFGTTWTVNLFVFAGIFVMVLLANGAVALGAGRFPRAAGILLALSLLGWYLFPRATLNSLPFVPRALLGTGLVALPILFAGVLFSSAFARRARPEIAFGFNLIGAMLGGALEALSLAWGLKALTLVALALYALAALVPRRPPAPA